MEENPKNLNFVNFITALFLLPTGVVIGGSAGMFFTLIGATASLYQIFSYKGFIDGEIFLKIRKFFWDREDAPVDNISRMGATAYLILLLLTMIYYNIRITSDQIIYIGIFAAVLVRKTKKFLSDWLPFAVLIFAYDAMRGIADNLGTQVHFMELIYAEKLLFFGQLPTMWLQEHFYTYGVTGVHDIIAIIFYSLHFTPPALFGVYIWIKRDSFFKKYRDSMILVSYAALLTFLLYPAAPPWLASNEGLIPHVNKIIFEVDSSYLPASFSTLYVLVNANPVAAIPSLHAAYPWVTFIFAMKLWGKKGLPMILLPFGVGFSSIYLGEHYIIDIIIGFIYATLVYLVVERIYNRTKSENPQPKTQEDES